MTYAIDVNVLLYAAQEDSPLHSQARDAIRRIFEDPEIVYVYWPTAMAFLRISTHHGIFNQPLSQETATRAIEVLLALPNVLTGGETSQFWAHYLAATRGLSVRGNLVPDAHLVALMRQHGVRRILTHDRDFRKFDDIDVLDPFA